MAQVVRTAARAEATVQELHVKHGILGPILPADATLHAALRSADLRHLQLRLKHVAATAPLVEAICDVLVETNLRLAAPREVRVMMHRASFDRACGGGRGGYCCRFPEGSPTGGITRG